MTRCLSCNGIIARNEQACYVCGERLPKPARRTGRMVFAVLAVIAVVGFVARSFI